MGLATLATRFAPAATLVLIASLLGACGRGRDSGDVPPGGPTIRIRVLPDQAGRALISARGTVRISTLPDLILRFEGPLPRETSLEPDGEGFRLAGQYYASPFRMSSPGLHSIEIRAASAPAASARAYRGVLDLFCIDGRLRAINQVSLEEYLAGVVGAEMYADFPPAALEAQAIASRTYAIYNLLVFGKRPMDKAFEGTASFQAYGGRSSENPSARKAVRDTAGWVMTYRGKLFPAYFHSTCGGNTTNGAWIFGDEEIPPLRGVPCNSCDLSQSWYRWNLEVPLEQMEGILQEWASGNKVSLGSLRNIQGVEPLPGGYLRYLRIAGSLGSFEIRADVFKRTLERAGVHLFSTSIELTLDPDRQVFQIAGKGCGHGVGMCQYGAGRKGMSLTSGQVLAHYYPECELKKVY